MPNRIDSIIERVSPSWAARRQEARARAAVHKEIEAYAKHIARREESVFGGGNGFKASYAGGVATRVDPVVPTVLGDAEFKDRSVMLGAADSPAYLRLRARRLVNNNNLASALVNASTDFVIGSGTRIEPMTADKEWNREAQEFWDDYWLGRNGGSPDLRGLCGGPELERLLYAAHIRDGDCGVILLDDGRLQAVEGDLIETPHDKLGDPRFRDGVEVNGFNRPVAFWIRTQDPANPYNPRWTRVDAENFCFIPRLKNLGQVRGETAFRQSFTLFEQIEGYIDGVVMAARMAAMFGLLIKESPTGPTFSGLPRTTDAQGNQRRLFDMEAAMVKFLPPGASVEQVKPEQPTTQFDPFIRTSVRLAGLELALPLELALLDFSQTTYSSARASMNVAQRSAIAKHGCWCECLMSRVYRWRISKAIKAGGLREPSDGQPWLHRAIQEPFAALDKHKDVEGDLLAVDAGFQLQGEAMMGWSGMRMDEYTTRRKAELQELRSAGIVLGRPVTTRDDPAAKADQVKEEMDAYGVAVRAGAITPQIEDEVAFRERFGLPLVSDGVRKTWEETGGTRRPITIAEAEQPAPEEAAKPEEPASGDEEEPEQEEEAETDE